MLIRSNKDSKLFSQVEFPQKELKFLIEASKKKYYHVSQKE